MLHCCSSASACASASAGASAIPSVVCVRDSVFISFVSFVFFCPPFAISMYDSTLH